MSIAIITGATSGIGHSFFLSLKDKKIDQIWAISRNQQNLDKLSSEIQIPVRTFSFDLSNTEDIEKFYGILREEKPQVQYLIECSGFGTFQSVEKTDREVLENMVDLNCRSVVSITKMCIPYMLKDSLIMVISSVAAFQPIPYIATYAASKSFVLSFIRALNQELKNQSIHVMAVCPFWTKTNFFARAKVTEEQIVKKYTVMYLPENIVKKAWKDAKHKNRDVSIYGGKSRAQCRLVKILPHKWVMHIWMKEQKLK